MTSRTLFGLETEYAIAGTLPDGAPIHPEELARALLARASAQLKWINSSRAGDLFLENGSRLYVDCGGHPELATPECHDPWEAVRFARAGDRIIAELASDLEKRYPDGSKVMVFRSNVDYAGARTTWGCHESYLYRSPSHLITDDLVPHLVSRLIYTGAGGFNPTATGIVFSLSPRVAYLRQVESHDSLSQRGIVHTRQEPLARPPYQRLHLIVGDTVSSDVALWLKMGTTALVLAMIDGGLRPGAAVQLEEPIGALRTFAGDPTCRMRARLRSGDQASAIDIQRHFVSLAERHRDAWFMPPWAGDVCAKWRDVLDRLEGAPASVATELDWAIKHVLFDDYIHRHGCDWQRLSEATSAIRARQPTSVADWLELTDYDGVDDEDEDNDEEGVSASAVAAASTSPEASIARALLELDLRFGQIAPAGIFQSLNSMCVLAHRVEGVSDRSIERAMRYPPPRGRARVRGQLVSRLSAERGAYSCDWSGVWHVASGRWVDLSDPFMEQEQWKEKAGAVHHVST